MAQIPTKKALEEKFKGYFQVEGVQKSVEENPWNYAARELLAEIRGKNGGYYSEAGPDTVKYAADLELGKAKKQLESVPYSWLVQCLDNEQLKGLLSRSPALKDDGSDLASAHKKFCEVREYYEQGKKLSIKDPDTFRHLAIDGATDEADAYYAAGRTESSRRVFEGLYLESKRNFYATINRTKPKQIT